MINATHIKVPYRAECLQLTETNALEVIDFLHREGYTAWQVSGFVYYSRPDQGTCGLPVSWWIRKGEDGVIKFLPDDLFQLKYRKIEDKDDNC